MQVEPGTIVIYSDIGCPWATVVVHRLHDARVRLGLTDRIAIDHRVFALEEHNAQPTPRRTLDAEIPVVGSLAPDFGFQLWQGEHDWPVTTLPALEAVQAAKAQSLEASVQLDLALRRAFFAESRCISLRAVILDVARRCAAVDAAALRDVLDDGRARRQVIEQSEGAADAGVDGSPHLFLPDGSDHFNPGVEMHWQGEHGKGFPVVDADDPKVIDDLVQRAASSRVRTRPR